MKIAVGGEALGQKLGANDLAILHDETPCGLVRERYTGDCSYQEGIADTNQNDRHECEANGRLPNGMCSRRGICRRSLRHCEH